MALERSFSPRRRPQWCRCHIAADLASRAESLHGGPAVLLDVDEHMGGFGGARAYLADPQAPRPAGVMIGYPGRAEVSGFPVPPKLSVTPFHGDQGFPVTTPTGGM